MSSHRRRNQKTPQQSAKCATCQGTGEVISAAQRASRCPDCFGSGFAKQTGDRRVRAFVFGSLSR